MMDTEQIEEQNIVELTQVHKDLIHNNFTEEFQLFISWKIICQGTWMIMKSSEEEELILIATVNICISIP